MASGETDTLIPLADYRPPAAPADDNIRRVRNRFWRWLRPERENTFLSDNSLESAQDRLRDLAPAPPYDDAIHDIDAGFQGWLANRTPTRWQQVLVMPGCEDSDIVKIWGAKRGFAVIEPPSFDEILRGSSETLHGVRQTHASEPVCIIARLEQWFVRHQRGLDVVRWLLDEIATCNAHWVIGCNAWAWDFLANVVGVLSVLPNPLSLRPMEADRLGNWFTEIAASEVGPSGTLPCFRRAKDGKNVLSRTADDRFESDYLQTLASRSLGVPWIAWHQWRSSLRLRPDAESNGDKAQDGVREDREREAIWVSELPEKSLPDKVRSESLLMLHALLMHGPLSSAQLSVVLPSVDIANVAAALQLNRFVLRDRDVLRCRPAAYSSIRRHLLAAGVAVDVI